MVKNGLGKIKPDARDYSIVKTFGALPADAAGLPEFFSVYDGRPIPNQDAVDDRFYPPLPPLPYGCTGETGTFDAGLQDNDVYNPSDMYYNTPPGTQNEGRDMRASLATLKIRGPVRQNGTFGPKRVEYFNCYGAGAIDDFDAIRIALWINQNEKRGVWAGWWWYPDFAVPFADGTLKTPSYDTRQASLHAHLITGWKTIRGERYLESVSWQGMEYGQKGLVYFSREQVNKLLKQPWTGCFTQTKLGANAPVPVGMQAVVDHLVYFVRQLFGI